MSIWPTSIYTRLTDEETRTGLRRLLNCLPPRPHTCTLTLTRLSQLPPQQYTRHVLTCASCGARNYHHRHEKVVHGVARTLNHHGIRAEANPTNLPIPGNDRGGPDIKAITEQMMLVDVAVTCDPPNGNVSQRIQTVNNMRLTKYKPMQNTAWTILPLVCTIHGEISHTVKPQFQRWSQSCVSETLQQDLYIRIAIIKGFHAGIEVLHTLHGTEESIPTVLPLNPSNSRDSCPNSNLSFAAGAEHPPGQNGAE